MITTVTTTTTNTLSTTTSLSLAVIAIISLVIVLITKETLLASTNEQAKRLSKILNIIIIPLIMVFAFTAMIQLLGLVG